MVGWAGAVWGQNLRVGQGPGWPGGKRPRFFERNYFLWGGLAGPKAPRFFPGFQLRAPKAEFGLKNPGGKEGFQPLRFGDLDLDWIGCRPRDGSVRL